MSQSRAILTLHRRTGGDTQGERALSRRTVRARGAPRLPCREQRVTARTSRPGPASKLPSFGRRGLGENPANAVGRRRRLFVFKKNPGVRAGGWALRGRPEAAVGGGRKGDCWGRRPSGSWVSGVAPGTAEACRRRGQRGDPGAIVQEVAAALHTRGLRQLTSAACGAAGAGAWAALARLRPARTPRPQLRVQRSPAVFVQLRSSPAARPPGRGPRLESPPEPRQPRYQRLGTAAAAPARARETW